MTLSAVLPASPVGPGPSLFLDAWRPGRPLASDDVRRGVHRESRESAVRRAYVQPNGAGSSRIIPLDIDHAGARWSLSQHPVGRLMAGIVNYRDDARPDPLTQTSHGLIVLASPVATSDKARARPRDLLAAISVSVTDALAADPAYRGTTMRNPLSSAWETTWADDPQAVQFSDLIEALNGELLYPRVWRARQVTDVATFGRNCFIFETARVQAYRLWRESGFKEAPFVKAVVALCHDINDTRAQIAEATPLTTHEVDRIAASITRWVMAHHTREGAQAWFSARQSYRGSRPRPAARAFDHDAMRAMKADGVSWQIIADTLGVSVNTAKQAWKRDSAKAK